MRIDLWLPTASPFTTPEVLAVIGAEAEQRGVGTIWVGEHVVLFDEYASSYPYAEDGRIPAAPGTGLLEPLNTLSFLAAHTTSVRLGTAVLLLPEVEVVAVDDVLWLVLVKVVPAMRYLMVVQGASRMSSWSMPIMLAPLRLSTPMTLKVTF